MAFPTTTPATRWSGAANSPKASSPTTAERRSPRPTRSPTSGGRWSRSSAQTAAPSRPRPLPTSRSGSSPISSTASEACGSTARSGALAALLALTRLPILANGTRAYVDLPYMVLLLAALVLRDPPPSRRLAGPRAAGARRAAAPGGLALLSCLRRLSPARGATGPGAAEAGPAEALGAGRRCSSACPGRLGAGALAAASTSSRPATRSTRSSPLTAGWRRWNGRRYWSSSSSAGRTG